MAVDLNSLLGTIENILKTNNTNTSSYDVSNNLNKRVKVFHKGVRGLHETVPVQKSLYPAIFLELDTKEENFGLIGNTAKRDMEIKVDVIAVTDYQSADKKEISDKEIIYLTQNIEEVFRNYTRLSTTATVLENISNTDYSVVNNESTYNCMSRMTLTIKAWST